jgi:hypothetical protein
MFGRKKNGRSRCTTCVYFDNDPTRFKAVLADNGFCRRYPPYKTEVVGNKVYGKPIIVRYDDLACGEYKKGNGDG